MQVQRIDFPTTEGVGARYVVALAFSPCGTRLVAVTGDNRHTVTMFDWQTKAAVFTGNGHNGQPPQVRVAAEARRACACMCPLLMGIALCSHMLWQETGAVCVCVMASCK
jgi:hypothetical protein